MRAVASLALALNLLNAQVSMAQQAGLGPFKTVGNKARSQPHVCAYIRAFSLTFTLHAFFPRRCMTPPATGLYSVVSAYLALSTCAVRMAPSWRL